MCPSAIMLKTKLNSYEILSSIRRHRKWRKINVNNKINIKYDWNQTLLYAWMIQMIHSLKTNERTNERRKNARKISRCILFVYILFLIKLYFVFTLLSLVPVKLPRHVLLSFRLQNLYNKKLDETKNTLKQNNWAKQEQQTKTHTNKYTTGKKWIFLMWQKNVYLSFIEWTWHD